MCVIAIKSKGIDMPTETLIEDMWHSNSDGAGFMYQRNGRVYIEKGFMRLKDLKNALSGLSERLKKDDLTLKDIPLIMHFRITTHGGTSAANTHPFPVTYKAEGLQATDIKTTLGMVHNGIINSVTTSGTFSDTMIYIQKIVYPLISIAGRYKLDDNMKLLLENTIGASKLAFLDREGEITTIGNFHEEAGIFYSNLNHTYVSTYPTSAACSGYSSSYARARKEGPLRSLLLTEVPKGAYLVALQQKHEEFLYIMNTLNAQERLDYITAAVKGKSSIISHTKKVDSYLRNYVDEDGFVYYAISTLRPVAGATLEVYESYYYNLAYELGDDGELHLIELDDAIVVGDLYSW